MTLTIKNPEAHRMAAELARITGKTMTQVVTEALQERLAREHPRPSAGADRLLAIGRDCAARLKEPYRSADHGDLLYDEKGLPQ